jgi:hypothetical protein
MYAAYTEFFNRQDIQGVTRYVGAPYVMTIGGDPPVVVMTVDAIKTLFEQLLAGIKARGWVRSAFEIIRIWPMSSGHALLLTDITRYRADGSVLETGRYLYAARAAVPAWLITSVTDISPPFAGPGDFPRD